MQNKLRQLIVSALKRNEFTARLPLHINLKGYEVTISGAVPSEEMIFEVVVTVESVSPNLRVRSRMQITSKQHATVR